MKAICYRDYGVDNLKLEEVEKPTPADNEVLVRVRAGSLNPIDGHFLRGVAVSRLLLGLRKPRFPRFGSDFSGTVEGAGKNVTQFKPGDDVFGVKRGAMAEYMCAVADREVALKPTNVTFVQAASVPIAALTALQGLRDKGHIKTGQRVLINGASGGVGTFALQIAKSFGAHVTGVCSTGNVDLVRSIGADRVIDYTKEDFTKGAERYDLIYDLVGNHSFSARRRVLTPNGICIMAGIGGGGLHPGSWARLGGSLKALFLSLFVKQKFVMLVAKLSKEDLGLLGDLMQAGKVTPVIDRTYQLGDAPDAVRYLEEGHARGKVVVLLE